MRRTDDDRVKAVRDLVQLRTGLAEAIRRLKDSGWDCDTELVTLTRADAIRVLRVYLDGPVSADAVAEWADAVEGRDDIGLEEGSEPLLKELVFELATPDLAGPITRLRARNWLRRLA